MNSKEPYELAENSTNRDIQFSEQGLFSKVFHTHLRKIFKNNSETFNFQNLFEMDKSYTYKQNLKEFKEIEKSEIWEQYLKKEKNFLQVIFQLLGWRYKAGLILDLFGVIFIIPIPILVKELIDWLSQKEDPENKNGFFICGIIVIFMVVNYFLRHTALHNFAYGRAKAESFCRVYFFLIIFLRFLFHQKLKIYPLEV